MSEQIDTPPIADISHGSLTAEQVAYHTDALTRHYGEPVRPVSHYCDAFRTWWRAIDAKLARIDAGEEADYETERWRSISGALALLQTPILKSNLLSRLIYAGQPLRTEMCPVHKGHWSGYGNVAFGGEHPCECQEGCYDITGWLPVHERDLSERIALFAKRQGWRPASFTCHFSGSPSYDAKWPNVATAGEFRAVGVTMEEAVERLAAYISGAGFKVDQDAKSRGRDTTDGVSRPSEEPSVPSTVEER